MSRIIGIAALAVLLLAAGTVRAQQENTELESTRAELEAAYRQLAEARAQLEEAARGVALRSTVTLPAEGAQAFVLNRQLGAPRGRLGLTLTDAPNGSLVTRVEPGSSAEEGGVEVGDVVIAIDDVALDGDDPASGVIVEYLREIEPDTTVTLAVEREGRTLELEVEARGAAATGFSFESNGGNFRVLADRLEIADASAGPGGIFVSGGPNIEIFRRTLSLASSVWGDMELVPMTETLGRYFGTTEGLLVIRAPSDDAIDIEDGDVILAIGTRTPNSPEHAIRILSSFEPGETIEFSIMREGRRQTVTHVVPQSD